MKMGAQFVLVLRVGKRQALMDLNARTNEMVRVRRHREEFLV